MIKPWLQTHSAALGDFRIFRVRSDKKISPRTEQPHDFFVIDCVNWVNVVAITSPSELRKSICTPDNGRSGCGW